jgi:hypothetical protein
LAHLLKTCNDGRQEEWSTMPPVTPMLKLAWDFLLSLFFRALFVLALLGGASFLVWTYHSWRTGYWKDNPDTARVAFALAGVATLVGLIGTFRRGKAEANFSLVAVAGIVAATGLGHVHAPGAHAAGRTLRRFPSIEGVILGSLLVTLWLAGAVWQGEPWVFRAGAIIGGVLIAWGLALERSYRIRKDSMLARQRVLEEQSSPIGGNANQPPGALLPDAPLSHDCLSRGERASIMIVSAFCLLLLLAMQGLFWHCRTLAVRAEEGSVRWLFFAVCLAIDAAVVSTLYQGIRGKRTKMTNWVLTNLRSK